MKKISLLGIISKILLALLSPLLLNVCTSLITGNGFDIRYYSTLLAYLLVNLVIIIFYPLYLLFKQESSKNNVITSGTFFTYSLSIAIIFLSFILYLVPYRAYLKEPEAYIQEVVKQLSTQSSQENIISSTNTPNIPTHSILLTEIPKKNILSNSCLLANKWAAYRSNSFTTTNNCWNIPGLVPIDDHLDFFINNQSKFGTFGIYTPINNFTKISIDLIIEQFNIPKGCNYARVFFGIVPSPDPHPNYGMMFFLQMESNSQAKPYIKYRNPNAINTNSLNEEIVLRENHTFDLILNDQYMNFLVDGHLIGDKFSLPDNPDYFWIGFEANDKGTYLEATINSIVIE